MFWKRVSVFVCLCLVLSVSCKVFAQGAEYDVIRYDINLDVAHLLPNRHTGYTEVELRLEDRADGILRLDLISHGVDSVLLNGESVEFVYADNKIDVPLSENISDNDVLYIKVYYTGGANAESYGWGGFHYSGSIIYNLGVALMDSPHSYGRAWFACKDSFTDKARYDFHITVNKDVKAICGGHLDSISQGVDQDTYYWTLNQEIPTYLASLTIGNFKLLERELVSGGETLPLQVYYLAQDSAKVYRAFSKFDLAFENMERLFGKYRFGRVGYCLTPQGSMEHAENISLVRSVIGDTLAESQSVIVHEFAHSWFGNLMTCASAGDMWINEGWTTFTERANLEAMYGEDYAKNHFRKKADKVLRLLPWQEGVFALSGVEDDKTYSSTVYDKGALVVMSLKTYMGDSLFYRSVRRLLNDFAYSNIDSRTLCDSLSSYSGLDLHPFFNDYVFDTLMHHFAIRQVEFGQNSATFTIHSRTKASADTPCSYCRIPITFVAADFSTYKVLVEYDGTQSPHTVLLPFTPVAAMLDMEEEYFDLTLDSYKKIAPSGLYKYDESGFRLFANACTDTVLVRAILHFVGAEAQPQIQGVNRLSDCHYWTIETVGEQNADLQARFYYQLSSSANSFDPSLVSSYEFADSLMLFYRPDMTSAWEYVPTAAPNSPTGYLSAPLRKGDYIMAAGDRSLVGLQTPESRERSGLKIYPKPSSGKVNVEFGSLEEEAVLLVFDSAGREVARQNVEKGEKNISLNLHLPSGSYTMRLQTKQDCKSGVFLIR